MATIGRGSAVIQMQGGRTMKGKAAALAWGAVHLALHSTGEDRAKAVVDWTWAGFTHERPARITVRTDRGERESAESDPVGTR
jgi:NADH dehydrogenase FAD-containing subunit